jgi:hypothetical protein
VARLRPNGDGATRSRRAVQRGNHQFQRPVEESTVKTHVKRVLAKLDARDRVQTVIFAYEHGLTS